MAIHVAPELMNLESQEESNGQGSSFPGSHVREVFRAISAQMRQLQKERSEITSRVEQIRKVLVGLASMYGNELPEAEVDLFLGRILLDVEKPMGIQAILDRIQEREPHLLQHHRNPAASIATILNRLVQYGEAVSTLEGNRRTWVSAGTNK